VAVQPPARAAAETTADDAKSPASLGWALHHLAVASAAVDTVLASQLSLSSTDFLALKHLLSTDHPLGPVDLARLLGMSTGSAAALIHRLQRAGHIERHPHPDDRRRIIVQPTPSITAAITKSLEHLGVEVDKLRRQFTPKELAAIHRFLTSATKIHADYPARSKPALVRSTRRRRGPVG